MRIQHARRHIMVLLLALLVSGIAGYWYMVGERQTARPVFTAIPAGEARKRAFFDYLQPLVREENRAIAKDRSRLQGLADEVRNGGSPGWLDALWLEKLAGRYGLDAADGATQELLTSLTRRVDTVPESLALIQAAKESGWGTSRFAREGNNYFGQWCFEQGCGMVPASRAPTATHEVRRFDSVRAAIRSYLLNINTHSVYRRLRDLRAELRRNNQPLSGLRLADGLYYYSERRGAYVEEIRSMLRYNRELLASLQ